MKGILCFFLGILMFGHLHAQDSTQNKTQVKFLDQAPSNKDVSMITNRPGATEASRAVYHHGFQIEAGLEYGKIPNFKGANAFEEYIYLPTFGFQYGVSENVELRIFSTNYATRSFTDPGYTQFNYQLDNVTVGAKINLVNAKGFVPEMALLIDQGISTRPPTERTQWPTRALLAWGYSLPSNFSLAGNLGYINEKEYYDQYITYNNSLSYTMNMGYAIQENLGVFAEMFGQDRVDSGNGFPVNLDGGIWYRFTNKFQIDASGGYGFDVQNYYVNMGLSILFLK